jgi:chromosome partitioning protein
MYKIITFYNHKGGVSKTTTVFNTGAYLEKEKNRKVLLVDMDPQSNLTELFLSYLSDEDELPGTSIYDAFISRFSGDASRVDVKGIKLVEHPHYHNLYLLRGDPRFAIAETYFGNAIQQAITEAIHEKNTYLSVFRMLTDLVNMYNFNNIILDLGPSTGAIARLSLLCCDGFIVPITPDRFCNQAIGSLSKIIEDWIKKHELTKSTFEPYGLEFFNGKPKFIGAVSQNFKSYAGKTKRPYEEWERKIKETITTSIVNSKIIPKDDRVYQDIYISNIQDFGPLGVVAQITGKAIFDLSRNDTAYASASGSPWSGVALNNWLDRVGKYKDGIEKISKVLL